MKKVKTFKNAAHSFIYWIDFPLRIILIPIILIVLSIILLIINVHLQIERVTQQLHPLALSYTVYPYPSFINTTNPVISAGAACILDVNSGVFLYTKSPFVHYSMASTTKVMTALVALDYYKSNDVLTIQRNYVEGTTLHLFKGEQFYFKDLLYAMLLNSANDVAYAIADNYPGGMDQFIQAMNNKAKSLSLLNTEYTDPAGLQDDGDFTSVIDLAHLSAFALKNTTISQVVSTKYKYITTVNKWYPYQLINLNQLLGYDGIIGVKTGTTEGAGQVLITAKKDQQHVYIIIVMQSLDRYADTLDLLRTMDNNILFTDPLVSEK